MNLVEAEREKYTELWRDIPQYRDYSPGAENVQRFIEVMQPPPMSSILDIGCGTGIAGVEFAKLGHYSHWIDITDAGLLPEVKRSRFIKAPLWDQWNDSIGCEYGFCCDVMEHIPTEYTMLVIDRILSACHITWFQIALQPDQFGAMIGQPLHLTVRPFLWWLERLKLAGKVIDARDLCGQALYVVEK